MQSEIPALLKNPDARVVGVSVEDLNRLKVDLVASGTVADVAAADKVVLDYITSVSVQQTGNLKVAMDVNGTVRDVGSSEYFDKLGLQELGKTLPPELAGNYVSTLQIPQTAANEVAL
ncbi:hypothetical protein [Variovorax rhizosphaerae]|uniref:Uncharacterized protein n=1 Tax=Variovorax rhizosphaerae TaxID=1836200 RepID=A0ABU8WQ79_9BURK